MTDQTPSPLDTPANESDKAPDTFDPNEAKRVVIRIAEGEGLTVELDGHKLTGAIGFSIHAQPGMPAPSVLILMHVHELVFDSDSGMVAFMQPEQDEAPPAIPTMHEAVEAAIAAHLKRRRNTND